MHYKKVLGDSTKQRRKFRKRRTKRRRTKRRRKSRKRRKTKRRRKSRTKKAGTYSPLAKALLKEKARQYRRELPQASPAPPNLLDQMEGNTIPRTPKKNRKREREFRNRVGDGQREPKAIKLLSLN